MALTGSAAAHRFDLLTVLEHEYGHALGLNDLGGTATGALMSGTLTTGVRILPSTRDVTVRAAPVIQAPVVTLDKARPDPFRRKRVSPLPSRRPRPRYRPWPARCATAPSP